MTQINPNINQYTNMDYKKQALQQQAVRLPNYYYVPDSGFEVKSFKEIIKDADAMGIISPFFEHPLLILPTWLGLNFGLDAYSKACGGDYKGSLVAKAANLGDKIQESKLIQNKPVQSIISGLGSIKKAGGKAVQNSAILRAMRDTPSVPEWSMVKTQLFNQKQEVEHDFVRIAETLKLNEEGVAKLKDIGLNKSEKEMLKKVFNVQRISDIPEDKIVNQVLLTRLGRTQEQINSIMSRGAGANNAVKQEILKELGLTAEKINLIKDDIYGKYIDDVIQATGKVKDKVRMGAGHFKWLGPLTKPFERTIGCDEVYNKLHSMSGGARTATGRFTSKMMQMIHRGLTFGGGKAGTLLFIAPLLVEVAMNTKKADRDQKAGTFAGGLIESLSWVFTFPLALRMMHTFGGAQYAGMSKQQVEQYRKVLEEFNTKVKSGAFTAKADYDVARKTAKEQLKKLSKVKGQNILTKAVRKLARFVMLDLETFKGYRGSNILMNKIRQVPNFCKNVVGVPMRLVIFGALSTGVLDAIIKKCSTAVFGKSYDSIKQEEHQTEIKKQKQFLREDLNKRLYEAQRVKQYGANPETNTSLNPHQGSMLTSRAKGLNSNAVPEIQKEEKVDNYTYIPSSKNTIPRPVKPQSIDNYTYIPSSKCTIEPEAKDQEQQRRYIPSQAAANIQKNYDNSGLQSAFDRAQKAEDKALRVLAGNFDGM